MHVLLKWANKREVARELTRRGFSVSGETLNRWVRTNYEMAPAVERMVLDMYGLPETEEVPRPAWAEGLEARLEMVLWALRVSPEEQADLLARRAEGETWPPRDNDGAPPAATSQSANSP